MNDPINAASPHDVPWPTSDERLRVPDTSMLHGPETAAAQAITALERARDLPVAEQPAAPAGAARDGWVDLREAVRKHPLITLAAALAFGAVVARMAD
jgi:hypothetical protein